MPARLLYDEACAFCRAWVSWAQERRARVSFEPCTPGVIPGLSAGDCARTAWAVDGRGRTHSGARAVAVVWRSLPGARNLGWRVLGHAASIPPVSWLAALVYWFVARNRHRLPAPSKARRP